MERIFSNFNNAEITMLAPGQGWALNALHASFAVGAFVAPMLVLLCTQVFGSWKLMCSLLVFFGTMVTHDYSMGKNVITVLGTVVGMVFIMFLAVLFTTLVGKIVGLITNIVDEIQYRL